MKTLLMKYWGRLRSSFWFVPAAMACLAVALAVSAVELDKAVAGDFLQRLSWSYSGGAEGASLLLGTVAGSMIAIAGTVFSMTLVALSFASSQLGPRLLRNFMRDTVNQVVLGTFVATFVYCLLVLRTIRRADEGAFVPHVSVSIGMLLAIVSVGVLIYFIHHISVSIQADQVVAQVGKELDDGIDSLFPSDLGNTVSEALRGSSKASLPAAFAREACPVGALEDGYLQLIDADALMALASQEDLLLRLERRPGHYLAKGQTMVMVWPGDRVTEALVDEMNAAFVLGDQRTAAQDVEFSFQQLVEIAVRALSPGINDPFTAIACVTGWDQPCAVWPDATYPLHTDSILTGGCGWWRQDPRLQASWTRPSIRSGKMLVRSLPWRSACSMSSPRSQATYSVRMTRPAFGATPV